MHPINDKNFGTTGIAVSYYNGTGVVAGYITKQIGTDRFKVTDGSHPKTVRLAPTTAIANALAANPAFCTILAHPASNISADATFVPHYGVDSATLSAGGTGYTANDVLTITGGGGATITVSTVTGGVVATFTVSAVGSMTSFPANPVAVTGGSGTAARFNLKYKVATVTASGGAGYVGGERVSFNGMVATTQPTAHVATVTGGAVATVTVDTPGVGITTAASSLTVAGVENVRHIYDATVVTVQGHRFKWNLALTSGQPALLEIS